MTKKQLLILGGISFATFLLFKDNKKEKYSTEELEKINNFKSYLEDKDYIVLDKKNYKKLKNGNLLNLASLHNYYSIAKSVAKYVL